MYDFMIDLETTGTNPSDAGILQIAAVRFDLAKKEIDHEMFVASMWLPPRRYWDESTRIWWSNQNQEVFAKIQENAQDPAVIMKSLADWVVDRTGILEPRFWAKPITFDYTFVASYFNQLGIKNPFHYRAARDVNTWIECRTRKSPWDTWNTIEQTGDAHNALHDCIFQIQGLFSCDETLNT